MRQQRAAVKPTTATACPTHCSGGDCAARVCVPRSTGSAMRLECLHGRAERRPVSLEELRPAAARLEEDFRGLVGGHCDRARSRGPHRPDFGASRTLGAWRVETATGCRRSIGRAPGCAPGRARRGGVQQRQRTETQSLRQAEKTTARLPSRSTVPRLSHEERSGSPSTIPALQCSNRSGIRPIAFGHSSR